MASTNNSVIVEPRLVIALPPSSAMETTGTTMMMTDEEPPQPPTIRKREDCKIESSLHTLPKPLLREFRHIFGEKYLLDIMIENDNIMMNSQQQQHQQQQQPELLAIPTNQHARKDLVAVGDDIELEKDRLLNVFMDFARPLCERIRTMGYWADYIDPCSGLPMMTKDCNKVYSEVDGMECLLNYKAHNAGFCKVLTHPKWGSAVYPATIFAYAPRDQIQKIIEEYPRN